VVTNEQILTALKPVEDPELGMSIIDIGLVYRAEEVEGAIEVDFTLTYPGCPLGDQIQDDIVDRLARTFNMDVKANLVFTPPWGPERMSEEARIGLGYPI
jgi:metal-sulfur cluster biosynthetic enzyme